MSFDMVRQACSEMLEQKYLKLKYPILLELARYMINNCPQAVPKEKLPHYKLLGDLVPETKLFVLSGEIVEKANSTEVGEIDWNKIDLPFKTCAFEILGPHALAAMPTKDMISVIKTKTDRGEPYQGVPLFSLVIHELEPRKYLCFALEVSHTSASPSCWVVTENDGITYGYIRKICAALSTGRWGTERVRQYIKVGRGQNKTSHKINEIVRVCPRKTAESETPAFSGGIDWTHRWEVRGHWREISGIGKDREGKYEVANWTWVIPHVKGPEGKVLVKKTRVTQDYLSIPTPTESMNANV